jgi:cell wall-associated NlpC family hydrolase
LVNLRRLMSLRSFCAAGLLAFALTGVASADSVRVGSEAEVTSDDGVNIRANPAADARLVSTVNPAHFVFVVDGPASSPLGDWYKVEYDGDTGWVLGSFLAPARPREGVSRGNAGGRPSDDEAPRSTSQPSASTARIRVGAEAQVTTDDGLKLRARPGLEGEVMEIVRGTRFLYVLDGPEIFESGPWYKVDYDGNVGWVIGTYLEPAKPREAPPAVRREASAPAARAEAPRPAPIAAPPPKADEKAASTGGSKGGGIAQKALGLVGLRYAWGGNSPGTGFDCSGLVNYVMNAYGISPGRTSYAQAGAGRSVSSGELQPGDIVVFANTYAGGYDHTGIYIGGGRFVHAEDWDTGVVVSSVFGGYWGRHYAGARRPW